MRWQNSKFVFGLEKARGLQARTPRRMLVQESCSSNEAARKRDTARLKALLDALCL